MKLGSMVATDAKTAGGQQESDRPGLITGEELDDFIRRAQGRQEDGWSSVSSNLTSKGAWYHGIENGTLLSVRVFENGIWISPVEDGDE